MKRSAQHFALALLAALGAARVAAAQTPPPTLPPGLSGQDELDLQGRANLVVGAGARAYGMGGAFLSRADDATAASWNPAGLSYLRRPEVTAAGLRNVFDSDATSEAGDSRSRFQGTVLDFAAITYPLEVKSISGAAQVSFQRAIPFSGTRAILRGGSEISIDATGGFDVIALGTGWKVSRRWRVGATLNRWFNGFHQEQFRAVQGRTRELIADFDLEGWNVNLGLMFSPMESLNLGVVGKTPFTAKVRLTKSRTDFVTSSDGELIAVTTNAYDSDDVRLELPGAVGAGASWRLRSQLTISADYTRTFWSDARIDNYFFLPFAGGTGSPQPPIVPSLPFPSLTPTETQEDAQQVRLGVEYVWITSCLKVPLRAGYFIDRQIFGADDGIPWLNGVTAGIGVIAGPILFDVAYLYEPGTYDSGGVRNDLRTHRFFASLIYRHRGLP